MKFSFTDADGIIYDIEIFNHSDFFTIKRDQLYLYIKSKTLSIGYFVSDNKIDWSSFSEIPYDLQSYCDSLILRVNKIAAFE